ncbi:MAG: sugar transferase [Candidatus Dormibacteria bacterium]|jgi:exopolysaccharide biosynthesis polyprenyl glycosylphosphotransferase
MLTDEEVSLTGVRVSARRPALRLTLLPAERADGSPTRQIATARWRAALIGCDLLAAVGATLLAVVGRFGVAQPLGPTAPYVALVAVGPLAWVALLVMGGTYNERRIAAGTAEFGRVANAGLWMLAALVAASYVTHSEVSREVTAVAVLAMTCFSLAAHLVGRLLLHRRIRVGGAIHRVMVLGSEAEARGLVDHITRLPNAGLKVAGVFIAEGADRGMGSAFRVVCAVDEVIEAARDAGADTIAVAGSGVLSGADLRRLSWDLEGTGIRLLLAPDATELAGPRLVIRPVGGLPLLDVKEAGFTATARVLKSGLDRAGAAVLCIALSPLMAAIALAIRVSSPGPALFRQERVGRHGRAFTLLKFRTMYQGAHHQRDALLAHNEHDGVLFKIRKDPRVTPIGRFLRRYSLDELPQIWNVLTGTMSLIGPRPPLQAEVDAYPDDLRRRRLLVKPGMTGLWQVSGRSDLSWEETVRLDLEYVENWSVLLDAAVLWKTLRAVTSGRGAY